MSDKIYEFTVEGMADDTFTVLEFTGEEKISGPYRFFMQLVSIKNDIDFNTAVSAQCRLKIKQDSLFASRVSPDASGRNDVYIHGIVISITFNHYLRREGADDLFFYDVEMSHPMFWMSIDNRNLVYCDKSVPEIIAEEFDRAGLKSDEDFAMSIDSYRGNMSDDRDPHDFPRVSYITQYRESSLNFVDRLMQREGIYYFFTHSENSNKLHLVDNKDSHPEADPKTLSFDPGATLERGACIQELNVKFNRVIKKVRFRDYNFKRPDNFVDSEHDVHNDGIGETFIYGEKITNESDADNLARLRSELHLSRRNIVSGKSTASFLRPGHKFAVKHHLVDGFNQEYILTSLLHSGSQAQYVENEFGFRKDGMADLDYHNEFNALPAVIQFRPEMLASKTRINSTIPAHIDHDEINDTGAYKVKMPFDLSDKDEGKSSCWCRFMKQYVGTNFGQHFPLRKGTEVMIAFIDGDPDRPFIAGAMENATHTSVTNSKDVGCERLANGNFQMFSTKELGDNDLVSAIPEGSLAGFAARGITIDNGRISTTGFVRAPFAGMADGSSSADGVAGSLGQQVSTSGLAPSTITPTVITGRTNDQTNIVSANEQTLRSGVLFDEHAGDRHETHSGDRYVSNNGKTMMQDTVHLTSTIDTKAQTVIRSTNDKIMEIVSTPGSVMPSAGGSGSGSDAASAGFAMPDIDDLKRQYRMVGGKESASPEGNGGEDMARARQLLAGLNCEQRSALKNEILAISDELENGQYESAHMKYHNAVKRYFPDDAAMLGRYLHKNSEELQFAGFADSSRASSPKDFFSKLWGYEWQGVNADPVTTKVSSTIAKAELDVTGVNVESKVKGVDFSYSIVGYKADISDVCAKMDTEALIFKNRNEAKAIDTKAALAGQILTVLGGGADAEISGHAKISAGLQRAQTYISDTAVAANNNKMMAIQQCLEATTTNVTALKNGVEAVQSQVSAVVQETAGARGEVAATALQQSAARVDTDVLAVKNGAADISSKGAIIVT